MEIGSVDRGWEMGLVRIGRNFPAVSLESALTHRTMSIEYYKQGN